MSKRRSRATSVRLRISSLQGNLIQDSSIDQTTGEERIFSRLQLQDGRTISRVRLLGIVTAKIEGTTGNYAQLKLEDGSGAVILKSWDGTLNSYDEGAMIEIVGILRLSKTEESDSRWYVQPEVVSLVKEANRETIFRLETLRSAESLESPDTEVIISDPAKLKDHLEDLIQSLDKDGKGVTYEELRMQFPQISENEFENAIFELLMEGKISEPRPERYCFVEG